MNFFEIMGCIFTTLLAIFFALVLWGFFKVKAEMNKKPEQPKTNSDEQR